jgi:hypothetical protein
MAPRCRRVGAVHSIKSTRSDRDLTTSAFCLTTEEPKRRQLLRFGATERNRSRGRALRARTTANSQLHGNRSDLRCLNKYGRAFRSSSDRFICERMVWTMALFRTRNGAAQLGSCCRRSVHSTYSRLAAVSHRPLNAPQPEGDPVSLMALVSLWNHEHPKKSFPLFTQEPCRHVPVVPITRRETSITLAPRHARCHRLRRWAEHGAGSP